jgi:hypothetical protein
VNTSKPEGFRKMLEGMLHRHDSRRVFDAFTRLAACALAAQTREAEYLEEARRWDRPELNLFAQALGALVLEMESRPFEDILGGYYLDFALSSKGQQWHGEFHTPKTVCDLIAGMMLGDLASLPAEGPITVCEPAYYSNINQKGKSCETITVMGSLCESRDPSFSGRGVTQNIFLHFHEL